MGQNTPNKIYELNDTLLRLVKQFNELTSLLIEINNNIVDINEFVFKEIFEETMKYE